MNPSSNPQSSILDQQSSILDQVLEQPVGNSEENVVLLPFTEPGAMFYMEREVNLKFNFIPGKTRCGSQANNDVKLRIRIASGTRDSLGFVFDNAILTRLETALNGAHMSTSCEDLAIFAATMIKDNSRTPLKWISVGVESDFPGIIAFTWRDKEEMPSVKLLKEVCETEASAIKKSGGTVFRIERQHDASPLLKGCKR